MKVKFNLKDVSIKSEFGAAELGNIDYEVECEASEIVAMLEAVKSFVAAIRELEL